MIDKAAGVDIPFTDNKNRGGARYRAALGLLMGVERTRQMMKIGFIGTGNMGGALASAAVFDAVTVAYEKNVELKKASD